MTAKPRDLYEVWIDGTYHHDEKHGRHKAAGAAVLVNDATKQISGVMLHDLSAIKINNNNRAELWNGVATMERVARGKIKYLLTDSEYVYERLQGVMCRLESDMIASLKKRPIYERLEPALARHRRMVAVRGRGELITLADRFAGAAIKGTVEDVARHVFGHFVIAKVDETTSLVKPLWELAR